MARVSRTGDVQSCVVAGAIANKAHNGGESWVRLSWILGLRRLGFDVYFVEQGGQAGIAYLEQVAARFGLNGRISMVTTNGDAIYGLAATDLREVADRADFLVNISGNLSAPGLLSRFRRRAYIDIDPGYTQFWHTAGQLGAILGRHNAWFTVGENIGTPACPIPTDGIPWRAVRPPVVLEEWPIRSTQRTDRLTTIAAWRGAFGTIEAGGNRYGVKAHQWRGFLELPSMIPQQLEAALAIDAADEKDRRSLLEHGWHLVDPAKVAGDPERFRSYIQRSGGEFSVAQGIYVETSSGWFSDRTVGYLASGKPVLVQDTGFSRNLPTGEGLVTFTNLREAADGAMRIAESYTSHARVARQLAEEYFDSDRVLGMFLDDLGVERPTAS
jgi:hypothetical protein